VDSAAVDSNMVLGSAVAGAAVVVVTLQLASFELTVPAE
jgi:hypothetical protein